MFNYRAIAVVAILALTAAGCGSEDSSPGSVDPGGSETIVMDEFSYEPSSLELMAGSTVTLTFSNVGAVDHEVMIGSAATNGGGYETDLLARMRPEIIEGSGYDVSFSESAEMQEVAFSAQADDGHTHEGDEADDHHAEETTPDTSTPAEGHHEEGDETTEDHHHEAEGQHHGDHILVEPAGEVTVRLHVPDDAVGDWEIGCFIPGHYDGGMLAALTISPATA